MDLYNDVVILFVAVVFFCSIYTAILTSFIAQHMERKP